MAKAKEDRILALTKSQVEELIKAVQLGLRNINSGCGEICYTKLEKVYRKLNKLRDKPRRMWDSSGENEI